MVNGRGASGGIPNQCVIIVEVRSVYYSLLLVTTSSCLNKV